MFNVDRVKFAALCHKGTNPNAFLDEFIAQAPAFGITTALEAACFWGEALHESGGLQWLRELWGPTPEQIRYDPPYASAHQLGNIHLGDGFKYRGAGLFQTTGLGNFTALAKAINEPTIITNPELLAQPHLAVKSALFFWKSHNLNHFADLDQETLLSIRVNGGTNGLQDRLNLIEACKSVFS